jgi:hypothetical protein
MRRARETNTLADVLSRVYESTPVKELSSEEILEDLKSIRTLERTSIFQTVSKPNRKTAIRFTEVSTSLSVTEEKRECSGFYKNVSERRVASLAALAFSLPLKHESYLTIVLQ